MTKATTIRALAVTPRMEEARQAVDACFGRFCLTAGIEALQVMAADVGEPTMATVPALLTKGKPWADYCESEMPLKAAIIKSGRAAVAFGHRSRIRPQRRGPQDAYKDHLTNMIAWSAGRTRNGIRPHAKLVPPQMR